VTAVAPHDPSDVVIVQETSPGNVVASGGAGASIDFSWPAQAGVVYVEVQPALSALAVPSRAAIRCVLDGSAGDDGLLRGAIPTSLLDDAGSLVVHRVRTEPLQLRGVDDGELRFDFARVVGYVRQ
jgi:hypothetical protein